MSPKLPDDPNEGQRLIPSPQAFADLTDGRTLRPVSTVDIHSGPARVLVLQGLNRIIDVEQ